MLWMQWKTEDGGTPYTDPARESPRASSKGRMSEVVEVWYDEGVLSMSREQHN